MMKRLLSLLLALLLALLCGCAAAPGVKPTAASPVSTPAASPAPTAPAAQTPAPDASPSVTAAPDFEEAVAGQVFAAVMAAYCSVFPDGTLPDDPAFLAEATGWYAAWRWRTDGLKLLPLAEAEAFQRSLGGEGALTLDPDWEAYGIVQRRTDADGTEGLDFAQHKQALEALLGVTLELKTDAGDAPAVDTVVVRHFDSGDTAEREYRLLFAPNSASDGRFPYCLRDLTFPSVGPQMDPAFDFDWELLLEQNRITNLTRPGAVIKLSYSYDTERTTWIFDRGGDLCILNETGDVIYGEYRGAYFEYGPDAKGVVRARVSGFDENAGSRAYNDSLLTDLFSTVAVMRLDGIEDDLIRIRSVTEYGFRQDFEIDRGTLALRKEAYYYDSDEPASVVTVSYTEPLPDFAFLDSWDLPLRQVLGVWEDYYGGAVHTHTEGYLLPGDWEYLPWEGVFGDYTIYMNAGYTRSYFYPGDGMDYTLYLTTAKG